MSVLQTCHVLFCLSANTFEVFVFICVQVSVKFFLTVLAPSKNSSHATFINTSLCVNFHFPPPSFSLFPSSAFLSFLSLLLDSRFFSPFSLHSYLPLHHVFSFIFLTISSHCHHSLHLTHDCILCGLLLISDTCVSDTCVSFALFLTVLYSNYIYVFCNISRWRLSICSYASGLNLLWCILCMSQ